MKRDEETEGGERPLSLARGEWSVDPSTGIISLMEEALRKLVKSDPIEHWYILDPEPIARGQFAVVYHCHHRVTGKEYAAKVSSRWRFGIDSSSDLVHEIAVGAILRPTERAVQLVDVFSSERELVLIMEYAPGGDLQTLLDENLVPYERDVIRFMRQLLESLVFIHDRNIVHLDIKPQNLVLMGEFPDCDVKLCDFEISRMLSPGHEVREILGTPDYVAPEILHYEPITTRTDMWSVGVLTYVLLTGFLPFGGENDQETFLEISRCELDFPPQLFEDITPEAIDFISKLLIRQPERRMSARESLKHEWMKRPTPPKSFEEPLTPTSEPQTSKISPPLQPSLEQPPLPSAVIDDPSLPSSRKSSYDSVNSSSDDNETSIRDKLPSLNLVLSPTKDIGRPPLHPTSQKSIPGDSTPVIGTPVTTPGSLLGSPFIYKPEQRLGSKHNLERLRSLSKSREVLSERVQMSNLKKSQSKSRERLCEARLGLSKSREQLMALKSFSHSVEALSALSRMNNGLYQSCNNIFVPKIQQMKEDEAQNRMYQSMACIDQLDKLNESKKMGYFESRVSLKDEYNDLLTQRNTNMNCLIGDMTFDSPISPKGCGLKANTCKGGRGDKCDSVCSRNQHRHPEAQNTQKIRKVSKAEKMKKDAEKRRRERKEKEKEKEKIEKTKVKQEKDKQKNELDVQNIKNAERIGSTNPNSPTFRRGSVSHVEQRIQERHERNQERLEKQEKEERRQSRSKRLGSVDLERMHANDKQRSTKSGPQARQRPRSVTPTRRRKSKKESSPNVSDVSQASSLESFDVTSETIKPLLTIPDLKITPDPTEQTEVLTSEEPKDDADEAYVSLEESSKEAFRLRLNSIESNASSEPYSKEEHNEEESENEKLSVSEKIQNFEKVLISMQQNKLNSGRQKPPTHLCIPSDHSDASSMHSNELSIIAEEDTPEPNAIQPNFKRSISNTSDFGSLISEMSEDYQEKDFSSQKGSDTESERPPSDYKTRTRSMSIHTKSSYSSKPYHRLRSNSCNLEYSDCFVARPWGNVCSGSFARAFEKFNCNSNATSCESQTRRQSSPIISPTTEQLPLLH